MTARNRNIVQAIDSVAQKLGNTRAVCRKCYVHPAILAAYLDGITITGENGKLRAVSTTPASRLSAAERSVLSFLKRLSRDTARRGRLAA
jgi:DNA topoisomerase-1